MIYFANPVKDQACHQLMDMGVLGRMDVRQQGRYRDLSPNAIWCADNGCYSEKRFNIDRWFAWLSSLTFKDRCKFATAPDVYGDFDATLKRSAPWLPKIRDLGYPAALVAQDGAATDLLPWDDFDCLFIGGSNTFKLGDHARALVIEARRRHKWVHMGRVNSLKRYRYAESIGCHSVDGTQIIYGPSKWLPVIANWCADLDARPALFRWVDVCEA